MFLMFSQHLSLNHDQPCLDACLYNWNTFNFALPVAPETLRPSFVMSFKVKQLQQSMKKNAHLFQKQTHNFFMYFYS